MQYADNRIDRDDLLDLLSSLTDKSLVIYEEDEQGWGRYSMLETVRQYGHDRLAEHQEEAQSRGRHQSYYLALIEESETQANSPKPPARLSRLEEEHDNLRAALDWSQEEENGTEAGLRLSAALGTHWLIRGDLSEGRQWLSRTLKRDAQEQETQTASEKSEKKRQRAAWRSLAHLGAANLDWAVGDAEAARLSFEQALAAARQAEELTAVAYALRGLGMCRMSHAMVEDPAAVQALFEESLLLFRQADNSAGISFALRNLGDLAEFQGRYIAAEAFYRESLDVSHQHENNHGVAGSLVSLGRVAFAQGDLDQSQALSEEALALFRQIGDQGAIFYSLGRLGQTAFAKGEWDLARSLHAEALLIAQRMECAENIALTLSWLGRAAVRQGDPAAGGDLHAESLRLRREAGHYPAIAYSLAGFAEMAHRLHHSRRAACLLGAAHTLRQASGTHLMPVEQEEQASLRDAVRNALGEAVFTAAFAAGEAMTMEAAVEYALAGTDG